MARRSVPVVIGAGATALLASGGSSFVVPRVAEVTKTQVSVAGASYASSEATQVAPCLGLASVAGAAVAAAGLAATRRTARVAARDTSRVVCAAGNVGKKRCLVMGGTRFIGCYLVAKLREQGHDVVVCNRGKTNGGKPEPLPGAAWRKCFVLWCRKLAIRIDSFDSNLIPIQCPLCSNASLFMFAFLPLQCTLGERCRLSKDA